MSVPIAVTGLIPKTRISSGVIRLPPPMPVRPTRKPTPKPKKTIAGSTDEVGLGTGWGRVTAASGRRLFHNSRLAAARMIYDQPLTPHQAPGHDEAVEGGL